MERKGEVIPYRLTEDRKGGIWRLKVSEAEGVLC